LRAAKKRAFSNGRKAQTRAEVARYAAEIKALESSFTDVLNETIQIPGAAVVYHTFEYNQPTDLKAASQRLDSESPRRQYVTPLDTNTPAPFGSPSRNYKNEYPPVLDFSFLVDGDGAVHVRPFDSGPPSSGNTTNELSTITGDILPEQSLE
jgi:hypothetical protein